MIVDKKYCLSSFLQLRTIYDHDVCFCEEFAPFFFEENLDRNLVFSNLDLEKQLRNCVSEALSNGKCAICLSGGIDSAILATFMPKGSIAYTFRCIVPGVDVVDETVQAAKYARECGLIHKVINVYWEDHLAFSRLLMSHKGAPIHSIEVQIYKAALEAKKDGVDTLIFGESADVNFGGQDGLLSRDWTPCEYMERFSFVMPHLVLKNPIIINEPFFKYSDSGLMNAHEFNRHVYYCESMGSYLNATQTAGVKLCCPFSKTYMGSDLDLSRVRGGENKYLVRELFKRLYGDFPIPKKTPMPRPMNEWMSDWPGPSRPEFLDGIQLSKFSGDQKWMLYILELFLNMIDEKVAR